MTAITLDSGPNYFTRIKKPGFSEASEELDRFMAEQISDLQRAETWSKHSVIYALDKSHLESNKIRPGVRTHLLLHAASFLSMLPEWVPPPEAYLDEDGDIGFEWYFGDSRRVNIILELNSLIQYAALFSDGSKRYGTEMASDETPDSVVECLKKAMG